MKKILICCLACCSVVFSYAQRIPPSRLGKFQTMPTGPRRCYPLLFDRKIGIGYAIDNNLFGLKFHTSAGWKFGLPLQLITDLEYRPGYHGNGYFNIDLMRLESIAIGKKSLSLNAGYKRVFSHRTNINNQFFVGSSLSDWSYYMTVGYAVQRQVLSEKYIRYNHGIWLQYYREFFSQFEVKVSGVYWFDEFQYSIRLSENLFYSAFSIGLGYEKIGDREEVDVSVSYNY